MNCEFSNPRQIRKVNDVYQEIYPIQDNANFHYKNATCVLSGAELQPDIYTLIDSGTGETFFVNKTLSYGDILIFVFLTIFLIFGFVSFLNNFLIPQLMNFKRK